MMKDLEDLGDSSTDVVLANLLDKYANRPIRDFKNGTLKLISELPFAKFASYYQQVTLQETNDSQPEEL